MLARTWHGYTSRENAGAYEHLLTSRIFKNIKDKAGDGFMGVQLLKREFQGEIEFTTIMWFRDLQTIKNLTGEDYETAYIPPEARALLSRFDEKVTHANLTYSSKDF